MNSVVSVIIPTFNNQATIDTCLESIDGQSYDSVETIVVDGGSSDKTTDICHRYGVTLIETDLGRAAARVKGARVASGDYLFHVDSDMELSRELIQECVTLMSQFSALVIPETNVGNSYWAKCTDIGKSIARRNQAGFLRFLPRQLYFDVGGHNPRLIGKEDEELHNMVLEQGAQVGQTDNIIKHHLGDDRLFDILKQRWRYMRTLPAYDEFSRDKPSQKETSGGRVTISTLRREAVQRPHLFIGYLIIEGCTVFLSIINRVIEER